MSSFLNIPHIWCTACQSCYFFCIFFNLDCVNYLLRDFFFCTTEEINLNKGLTTYYYETGENRNHDTNILDIIIKKLTTRKINFELGLYLAFSAVLTLSKYVTHDLSFL